MQATTGRLIEGTVGVFICICYRQQHRRSSTAQFYARIGATCTPVRLLRDSLLLLFVIDFFGCCNLWSRKDDNHVFICHKAILGNISLKYKTFEHSKGCSKHKDGGCSVGVRVVCVFCVCNSSGLGHGFQSKWRNSSSVGFHVCAHLLTSAFSVWKDWRAAVFLKGGICTNFSIFTLCSFNLQW